MDKRISKKILLRVIGIFTIVIIVGYLFLFVLFPMIIMGGPTSLYFIGNHDTKNHTIVIKILDSTNKTVLLQSYKMQPDTTIQYARGFGWYPTVTWTPFTWSGGKYTFIAVLDGNFTASHTTNVQITQTIWIDIKFMGKTLEIGEAWV
jgi:hypothetical protein